jgi:hypothetical protein
MSLGHEAKFLSGIAGNFSIGRAASPFHSEGVKWWKNFKTVTGLPTSLP